MDNSRKMTGPERQVFILDQLKKAETPISGRELANMTNVSRQIIVQDVSLLKAKKEPIIATSQGYVYMMEKKTDGMKQRTIVCRHKPEETLEELQAIVDCGAYVYDVRVEHPVYGDLTGILNITNRQEAEKFVRSLKMTNASLLLELTDGLHLHTIAATTEDKLDAACEELKTRGFIFE
ncbi:transcription repressor NadR [Aciduricibacillus chroicocephali]|uniref:Transcription repressor NadR n=1 Tax=Aciduricibacillus chroicocephali TaxID=3054939 RepID=A0ABY9KTB3_9BACI|nr:transcription repressor NadR [Bacillaceae bacterium 44XB]